jgi:hypothetical protein
MDWPDGQGGRVHAEAQKRMGGAEIVVLAALPFTQSGHVVTRDDED